MMMIDPPSGWKFGFPKPFTKPKDQPLRDWLIENGLPEKDADFAVKYGCRYWSEDE